MWNAISFGSSDGRTLETRKRILQRQCKKGRAMIEQFSFEWVCPGQNFWAQDYKRMLTTGPTAQERARRYRCGRKKESQFKSVTSRQFLPHGIEPDSHGSSQDRLFTTYDCWLNKYCVSRGWRIVSLFLICVQTISCLEGQASRNKLSPSTTYSYLTTHIPHVNLYSYKLGMYRYRSTPPSTQKSNGRLSLLS